MTDDIAKTFTGKKLEWLKCLAVDKYVWPRAFEIGFCIIQHVNAKTGVAMLSDETIADETGSCRRDVLRGRARLRHAGWVTWERTSTANVYRPSFDKVESMLDVLIDRRDLRQERRQTRRRVVTRESHPKRRDVSRESQHDATPKSQHDVTPESNIHLMRNTLEGTPYRLSASKEELGLLERPEASSAASRRYGRQRILDGRARILAALASGPLRTTDLLAALGLPDTDRGPVDALLHKLVTAGKLERPARGQYALLPQK